MNESQMSLDIYTIHKPLVITYNIVDSKHTGTCIAINVLEILLFYGVIDKF